MDNDVDGSGEGDTSSSNTIGRNNGDNSHSINDSTDETNKRSESNSSCSTCELDKTQEADNDEYLEGQPKELARALKSVGDVSQTPLGRQRDSFLFLQEMCEIAKHVAETTRAPFFQILVDNGFFDVFAKNLMHEDLQLRTAW